MTLVLRATCACALALAVALAVRGFSSQDPRRVRSASPAPQLDRVPAAFVPNLGQWAHAARYVARLGPVTAFLEERGWWLSLVAKAPEPRTSRCMHERSQPARGASLRMAFLGSDEPELVPQAQLTGVHHYFLGNDPTRWRTDVPRHGAVLYRGLYPGVDLRAYEKDGHFEYDLILAPGADLTRVEVRVEGADALRIDADGTLVIDTAVGPLRQARPASHEVDVMGIRHDVACEYELRGSDRFGFVAPRWDAATLLVLDPGLVYSSFLGGSDFEVAEALAIDSSGAVTMVGITHSASFPTTPGAWDTTFSAGDAFVTRLDPSLPTALQLSYSTFLGGSSYDQAYGVSVDAVGVTTVTGCTGSQDFPTTRGAWDTTFNGLVWHDAFVTRLDPRLSGTLQLVYSTFLGGSGDDCASAIATKTMGMTTIAGRTLSIDFPTTQGAWDTTLRNQDGFVARIDPGLPSTQQLVYSTFLGGSAYDWAKAVAVDATGVATVAGDTASADFPTTPGAWDTSFNSGLPVGLDTFLARLDPSLPAPQQLVYSTFLGGSLDDSVYGQSIDAAGAVTVVGDTWSPDFPTTIGAWDNTLNGLGRFDAFIARLDPGLPRAQQLDYSTFLGGSVDDRASAVSVHASGSITVAGRTASTDFPTTPGAWDTVHGGGYYDAFVARLDRGLPATQQLVYATFLGGSSVDSATALAIDPTGCATVAGYTASTDFPATAGAWNTTFNGGQDDAFVTRLDLLPTGTRLYGASSPGCQGPLAVGVTSLPRIGNATFQITCDSTPPGTAGIALLAAGGLMNPLRVLGVDVWVDPSSAWLVTPSVWSNAGRAAFALPLPNNPWLVSQQLNAQLVWLGPTSPPPCPPLGLSASSALEITIQP